MYVLQTFRHMCTILQQVSFFTPSPYMTDHMAFLIDKKRIYHKNKIPLRIFPSREKFFAVFTITHQLIPCLGSECLLCHLLPFTSTTTVSSNRKTKFLPRTKLILHPEFVSHLRQTNKTQRLINWRR